MKLRLFSLLIVVLVVCGLTASVHAGQIELFLQRMERQQIQFTYIDPNNLGDPNAACIELAQVEDSNGTLGHISVNSPGFWRWVGKGLMIVGATATGALGGAAIGTAVPGLGTAAGAIIGGGAGLATGVGGAIVANTKCSYCGTQDIAVYDEIVVQTSGGDVDLAAATVSAVLDDAGVIAHPLSGGGILFQPSSSLFEGSKIVDESGVESPSGEVEIGVIDADGDIGTTSDRTVAVFFQDPVRGIQMGDEVLLFLDNVIPPGILTDGDPVKSRHMFLQTLLVTEAAGPKPSNYASGIALTPTLTWRPGYWAQDINGHQVYFHTNYNAVNNRTSSANKGRVTDPCYTPAWPLNIETTYYWAIDEYNEMGSPDGNTMWKGNVWRFTTIGPKAYNPQPADYATGVSVNPTLTWNPGYFVQDTNGHAVYFGTDHNDVNNATTSNPLIYKGRQDANNYTPAGLLYGLTTYYWRVDEVNDANPDSPWKGNVWRFATGNGVMDFCDLNHWPLGDAQLDIDSNGFLTVSNIGSDGNDGVRVALPEDITSLHVNYVDLGDPNQFPVGAYIQATSRGDVNGEPNHIVSTAQTVCTDTGEAVTTVDFSALEPSSLTAEYYLNGKLVLMEENINPVGPAWSSIRIPNNVRITLKIRIRIWPPRIRIKPDIHLTYCRIPWPFVMTPKGNIVQVDEIAVYAEDIAVPFGGYADMLLTAAHIPSLSITNETFSQCAVFLEGDINNDCVVDLDDVELMCRQWLSEGMVADIYPEGNPDSFVNFRDVSSLAHNWRINCNTDPSNPACEPLP
jgi:hypothetical protein